MTHVCRRRPTALVGCGLAVAGATAAFALPTGARASSAVRACSASQLVETLTADPGGGTAGTDYDTLRFTNLGSTCTLRGYPGVSAVSIDGRRMGRAAARQSGSERTVTLRGVTSSSASSATATIGFENTSAFRDCDQKLAAAIRVYAPNTSTAKDVPFVVDACSQGSDTFIEVKPVS